MEKVERAGIALRVIWRVCFLLPLMFIAIPVQMLALLSGTRARDLVPHYFHRCALFILQVRVRVFGARDTSCHLFVANHASWFDALPLGACLPVCFVAKAEMRHWPIFGFLTRLQRSFFVRRLRGKKLLEEMHALYERWRDGDNMLIFPEATTNNGIHLLPFRPAFFSPLIAIAGESASADVDEGAGQNNAPVLVQPVSILYSRKSGVAMGRGVRFPYAWLGQVSFLAHILFMLKSAPLTIDLYFSAPLRVSPVSERKDLARISEAAVRTGLDHLLTRAPDGARRNPQGLENQKKSVRLAAIKIKLEKYASVFFH